MQAAFPYIRHPALFSSSFSTCLMAPKREGTCSLENARVNCPRPQPASANFAAMMSDGESQMFDRVDSPAAGNAQGCRRRRHPKGLLLPVCHQPAGGASEAKIKSNSRRASLHYDAHLLEGLGATRARPGNGLQQDCNKYIQQ
jgi:hypothetical protein